MSLKSTDVKVEYNSDGEGEMTILVGDDSGIRFKYGKVWIDDSDPVQPVLQFGYEILAGEPVDKNKFIDNIAQLLHSTIMEQLQAGQVIYHGGKEPEGNHEKRLEETMEAMANEFYGAKKEASIFSGASQQVPTLGRFDSKPNESAMSFLDRLAAEGAAAMMEQKGRK